MAFQAGPIKIRGTIDGLSFYPSMFGWLVRRKGGPTRKQFLTSPACARSRENSREFARCSPLASKVRRLVIERTGNCDKTLYHRLFRLMSMLLKEDRLSVRGERDPMVGMNSLAGLMLIGEFTLRGGLSLYQLLVDAYFLTDRKEMTTINNEAGRVIRNTVHRSRPGLRRKPVNRQWTAKRQIPALARSLPFLVPDRLISEREKTPVPAFFDNSS